MRDASLVSVLGLALPLLFASGCKNTVDSPADVSAPTRTYLLPNDVHTGFGIGTAFRAVLSTNLANPTFLVADPTVATVRRVVASPPGFNDSFILVTPLKAGATEIIARSGDKDAESDLKVTGYTPEQLSLGAERYNNPANANSTDRRACASCHQQAGGADHSPFAIAGFSDSDILAAIKTGTYRHGQALNLDTGTHAWNLTEEEEVAIMAHLRALPPKGFVL